MTDLDKLIAGIEDGTFRRKLKSGEHPDTLVCRVFFRCNDQIVDVCNAYDGSLDAAKALHDALLPKNAYWWVESRPDGGKEIGVFIGDLGKTFSGQSTTPARAWLIAILKAYREVPK